MKIHYLNTDLDVVAGRDLGPLVVALEARGVIALHDVTQAENGCWYATFEIDEEDEQHDVPELALSVMLDAIESLEEEVRELWSECSLREFNIGYDCGDEPWAFNNGLSHRTLTRMAGAGASLRITLYPPDRNAEAPISEEG